MRKKAKAKAKPAVTVVHTVGQLELISSLIAEGNALKHELAKIKKAEYEAPRKAELCSVTCWSCDAKFIGNIGGDLCGPCFELAKRLTRQHVTPLVKIEKRVEALEERVMDLEQRLDD